MMDLLGTVPAAGISPETVGVIIASVIVQLIGLGVIGKKVSDANRVATTIDGQPISVQMAEDFVTRREFDELKINVGMNATRAEGYFREASNEMRMAVAAMTKSLEKQNERLTAEIGKVAAGAYEGRQRIHTKVNEQGEQIAALKAQVNVASELQEVGEAIVATLKACQGNRSTR